jgi:hypothetical protein
VSPYDSLETQRSSSIVWLQLACRLEAGGKLVLVDFCRCGGWYLSVSMYMVKRGASEHAEQHDSKGCQRWSAG